MPNYITVKEYTVKGEKITITVTPGGWFQAFHNDDMTQPIASAYTLEGVDTQVAKIIRQYKRIRIEVPFTTPYFVPAVAVGRHARTKDILIKVKGRAAKIGWWTSRHVYQPNLPAKALEERQKLEGLRLKINHRIEEWEKKYQFDLAAAVDAATLEQEQLLASTDDDTPNDQHQGRP